MRVAFLSLISDTGHVVPLLKIAKIFQSHLSEVLYIGPSETQSLSESAGIAFQDIGTVRPANGHKYMKVLTAKTNKWRYLIYSTWFDVNYTEKSIFNAHQKKYRLLDEARKFDPDLIIADDHFFLDVFCDIAAQLGKPLIINNSEGSFHKEWDDIHSEQGFEVSFYTAISCILQVGYFISKWLYSPSFMSRRLKEKRKKLFAKAMSLRLETIPDTKIHIKAISPGISYLESTLIPDKISGCHKTQNMGPLPIVAEGKLENGLRDWLDACDQAIYVSFGTMIQIEANLIEKILAAIDELQINVLWVSTVCPNKAIFTAKPEKLRWVDWVSQTDVLDHPSIKVFLTHGGAGGVQESIWFGVPMVIIPHIWDQFYNAHRAEQFGVAIRLDRKKTTKEEIMRAVQGAMNLSDHTEEVSNKFKAAECTNEIVAIANECISVERVPISKCKQGKSTKCSVFSKIN